MSRTKPDRRTQRTQQSLHQALNRLILEKGYEETTIKDIVDQANVGRSTFYAHHGSKEGLLLSGLEHLRSALLAHQRETLPGSGAAKAASLGFSRMFFEHVREYRDVLRALLANENGPLVTRKIKRLLADVVENDLRAQKAEGGPGTLPREAVVQFTVDALVSVLLWWFDRRPTMLPAEADRLFRRLMLPALTAAGF